MRKRLIEKLTNKKKGTLGYTLTEMLVVVGIIAIACAIAIPSIISISKALKFAQANNYAKSIFLAAQQNLSELRSDGSLAPLQGSNVSAIRIPEDHCGFPDEDWSDEYVYTASDMLVAEGQVSAYDLVLPVNSVEGTLRTEHVIIEYNPITGNVYAVFYCEDDSQQILNQYQEGNLPRDEDDRRKMSLGYYDGSGLSSSDLELERSQAEVLFTNGEEGVVTVKVPVPSHYYSKLDAFILGLEVELTITGDNFGGTKVVTIKKAGEALNPEEALDETRNSVLIHYNLDSLADSGSFANLSVRTENEAAEEGAAPVSEDSVYLSQLTDADFITGTTVNKILPGDNVTIQADITFINEDGDPAVTIRPGVLAGINPMFDYLLTSPTDPSKFTLAVANGRNLQNLNTIHPKVADCVESVVFTADINWNTTVAYYNDEYGTSGTYSNNAAEAPGRALPYFVPIQNEHLFGTAEFVYIDDENLSGIADLLNRFWEIIYGSNPAREKVPTLTDELDTRTVDGVQIGDTHAKIDGQGHKVYFLNVDATRYEPCAASFYALGDTQSVNYYFAGLFGYVNTTINDLHVVNPIIKGHNFVNQDAAGNTVYMDPATGALVGAAGYNVLITNCSTYLDTTMEGFNWAYGLGTAQKIYDAEAEMTWYGVSGEGAVGGLVGYAKSHRTVVGELNSADTRYLAFSNSFAAVPVSGNLRGNTNKDYGYSNGIGGFIGNSQLTNFYNCYSSGKIMACNTYYSNAGWQDSAATLLGLGGNGRLAQGAGGFVGTSHGTRYTNCFSTSNVVNNNGNASTGGFVGMMCYDATKKYGHHADNLAKANVDQHTVFDSCYATGICTNSAGAYLESFSGANGKIVVNYGTLRTFYTGDYYKLLAPYALTHYNRANNTYSYPPYDELYIFKDSYYLSQYKGTAGVNQQSPSNKCAKPITYDELVNLHWKYNDETVGGWLDQQVAAAKTFPLDVTDINPVVSEILAEIFTLDFNDIIQGIFGNETENVKKVKEILNTLEEKQNYEVYFVIDKYRANSLETDYFNRYNEGFPSLPWENATDETTYYYGEVDAGKIYPFPKLNNLDYYGQWPEKTLDAGLAYFEVYSADGTEKGYYFDREDTSTLRNTEDVQVLSDGYCIFTANVDDVISVYINDSATAVVSGLTPNAAELPVIMESAITPDRNAYYVVNVPWSVLSVPSNGDYYYKMTISIYNPTSQTTKTVTAYFNPNVALSQVNSATRPNRLPTAISIRSARQLAALTGEPTMWGADYNYIQWLNINVDAYTASSFAYIEQDDVLDEIEDGGSIGNADHPFLGTYSGAGYAEVADIINFKPGTSGIFGVIGEGGEVNSLDVIYNVSEEEADSVLTLGNENADNAAVFAGINQGTISNVNLTLDQEVSLTAKTNAGLLVGSVAESDTANNDQGGVLSDCTVTVNKNAAITAPNAGLVIGASQNAVISDVTVTQNEQSAFSAEANYAGGFAGSLVNSEVSDVTVTLNAATVQAGAAGGFAGYAKGTGEETVSAVVVNLKGALENAMDADEDSGAVYAAGYMGVSDTMKHVNITVNAENDIIGSSAAGVFGSLNQGSVDNARATIKRTVNGAAEAAGFAVEMKRGDYIVKQCAVNLTTANSKILSEGRAAGFAVVAGCNAMATDVKLGAYGTSNVPTATGIIQGADGAAGYACSITGEVSDSHVRGSANIRSAEGNAAGFALEIANRVANAGVTPAMGDAARNYRYNSNDNMQISGVRAAGFVANVAENASVVNSYTLGTVSGTDTAAPAAVGFVLENNGTVDGSTSNVNIVGGYAFAGTNSSLIQNCYGWYSDENDAAYTAFAVDGDGRILSSYFVDLDLPEEETTDAETGESTTVHGDTVVLYNSEGTATEMLPSELSGTLHLLNTSTNIEWYSPAAYASKPYIDITPATYGYPMLRQHFGNWVTRPQYAYGLMYYEKHDTSAGIQWKYNILDLTNPAITVEEEVLSISNYDFSAVDQSVILDAGYALFCKTGTDPNTLFVGVSQNRFATTPIQDDTFQQVLTEFAAKVKGNSTSRYSFYEIQELGDMIFDRADETGEVRVVTWYANAIGTAGDAQSPFLIRTPEQFGHVAQLPAACFSQTHAIRVSDVTDAEGNVTTGKFTSIDNFAGTYNGNGLDLIVSEGNTWITTLSGSVQNVKLTVSGSVTAPVFGTVNGSLELDSAAVGSVSENGALVTLINNATDAANETGGSVTTGIITVGTGAGESFVPGAVNGTLFGTVNGSVTTGAITTGDVTGSLVNTVNASISTGDISAQAVSGKVFGTIGANVTTGTISLASAANGKVFEGVSAGTTTLGSITVTSGDVSGLFGAVSGGIVTGKGDSGSIVTLNGNATGSLFASVSGGATLQNFGVEISGSLNTSLIGSVSGAANDSGVITTTINNVDVTATGEADSFVGSGLLVNTLGDYTAVSNCDVLSRIVTVKNLAEYKVGETPTYPFGGITGVVPANAVLTNNKVQADMNVFGEADKLTVVGGVAAINSGTISGGKVTSNIHYFQASTTETATSDDGTVTETTVYDKAGIGGLVGWMLSGSRIEDIQAGGQINLLAEPAAPETPEDTEPSSPEDPGTETEEPSTEVPETRTAPVSAAGRDYFIGGAIAYDGGAEYSGVTTAVVVSDAWTGSNLVQKDDPVAAVNPSGRGCVGKFIGYVGAGSFSNCSATDTASNYQFLGEIEVNVDTATSPDPYSLYTSKSNQNNTNIDWTQDPTEEDLLSKGYQYQGTSYIWYDYPATLTGCTFGWTDADGVAQTYTQTFDLTYIYGGTKVKRDLYKAVNIGEPSYTKMENLVYEDFDPGRYDYDWDRIETDYFVKVESGQYYRVYVTYSEEYDYVWNENRLEREYYYSYVLWYVDASGATHELDNKQDLTDPGSTPYDGPALYTRTLVNSFSVGDVGTMYMIVTRDNMYALGLDGNQVAFQSEFDLESESGAAFKQAIWMITQSGNDIKWQNAHNTSQYLRLAREYSWGTERIIYNDGSGAPVKVNYRNRENSVAYFNVGGSNWLTHNDDGFGISRQNNYSDNADYRFYIYRIDRNGETWGTAFNLRDEISEFCIATDINGNVVILNPSAPPADDSTGEQEPVEDPTEPATEPVEAVTEPTEPATEPTEAVSGSMQPAAEITEPEATEAPAESTEPAAEVSQEPTEPTEPAESAEPTEPTSGEA